MNKHSQQFIYDMDKMKFSKLKEGMKKTHSDSKYIKKMYEK